MPNFTLVGWVDPYDVIASLRPRIQLFAGTGLRRLVLRGPPKGGDGEDEASFIDRKLRWPELSLLIRKIVDARPGLVPGHIYLELLDPGATQPLRRDTRPYALRHHRLLVGLRCNPAAYLWCPPDVWLMQPGQCVATPPGAWQAAINMGETPRITLVIDLKQEQRSVDHSGGEAVGLESV